MEGWWEASLLLCENEIRSVEQRPDARTPAVRDAGFVALNNVGRANQSADSSPGQPSSSVKLGNKPTSCRHTMTGHEVLGVSDSMAQAEG